MSALARWRALLCVAVAGGCVLLLGSARAAPGDLDLSFGAAGKVRTAIGSRRASATGLALQPDGKIVVAGSLTPEATHLPDGFAIARYLRNGALDPAFGQEGLVTSSRGSASAGIALQPDGKIVVAGRGTDDVFIVVRYQADGTIDSAFGRDGIATGPRGVATALAIQSDGRIVATGFDLNPEDDFRFILTRFHGDGGRDLGFGSDGIVRTRIGSGAFASDVQIQPDGRIVVAGYSIPDPSRIFTVMTLARYLPKGSLDATFGSNGIVTSALGSRFSGASEVQFQTDGRIVVAGGADVVRYASDGSLDQSFGNGGVATTLFASSRALDLQPDGKIVVAGDADDAFAVTRYDVHGDPDPVFGTEGVVTTKMDAQSGATTVAVQPDGRIVVAGYARDPAISRFAIARYLVTTPSTIGARPAVVDYGERVRVTGRLTTRRRGAVALVRRGCYADYVSPPRRLSAGAGGTWGTSFRPRSSTVVWAKVGLERTVLLTVRVRPRVSIRLLPSRRLRVRALFARPLAGETATLESYDPVAKSWVVEKVMRLRAVSRTAAGAVSGTTFRLQPGPRRWWRVLVLEPAVNPNPCFATASSSRVRR